MRIQLEEGAVKVAHAVANDDCRPIITYVLLDTEAKLAVGMNGFLLVTHPIKIIDRSPDEPLSILIKGKELLSAWRQSYKLDRKIRYLEITTQSVHEAYISNCALPVNIPIELGDENLWGKFPGYKHLFPKEEHKLQIGISRDYLKQAINCLTPFDSSIIKVRFRTHLDAIELKNGKTHTLLMPIFIDSHSWEDTS